MGRFGSVRSTQALKQTVLNSTDLNTAMKALNRLDNTPDWVLMNFVSNAASRDVAMEALNRLVAQEKVHGPRHLLNRVVTLGKMLHGDSSRGHYDVRMKIADIINDLYPELR